jgi:hypothetical protein
VRNVVGIEVNLQVSVSSEDDATGIDVYLFNRRTTTVDGEDVSGAMNENASAK